jgi:outer membrane receptor protein involved in Fe transport
MAPRQGLLALSIAAALVSPVAFAQQAQTNTTDATARQGETETAASDDAQKLQSVTVVGSRIKRATIEGPAPVTVITRDDIEREGFQSVGDMLQSLNQNTTASFTGDLAVSGFTPNAQVVNLRNLGPGYTLTLVNGRRPAQYPQPYNRDNNVVNVRAIPSSIVERIEVLTGGASAIYGSDAVAGVVNIVTRENFDGHYAEVTVGTTAEGGGNSTALEYSGGTTGEGWGAIWAFQASKTDPVFASQRDNFADSRNGPLGANVNPALALVAIRGNAAQGQPANQNAYYPGQAACDAFGYTTVTTAARGRYCGSFDQVASRSISNEAEFFSLYGRGTYDLAGDMQLWASATYYDASAKASAGTEFWGTSGDRFNRTTAGANTPFYFDPQFGGLIQLQRIFNPFELGGEEAASTLFDEKTWDVSGGITGTLGERFDWEASAGYSTYEYRADRPRLLAQAAHDYFLGPQLGFTSIYPTYRLDLNRWSNPITPDIYRQISTRVITEGETTSQNANFSITGDVFDLPAGAVGFAGTLEAVRQTVDLNSDPRTNPLRPADAQTIYNLTSSGRTEGTRDRYAVGAEFRVPVFSQLTATLAGRYDKYEDISDINGAFTYNLGLEYRPFESLLLRSSYATSFRAPDMQLIYAQGAASFNSALDEYSCRTGTGPAAGRGARTRQGCNVTGDPSIYQVQTTISGNPGLEEEKGESFSGGFVWDITDSLDVAADYYRIKLEDASAQLGADAILRAEAACRIGTFDNGQPAPSAASCADTLALVTRISAPGTPSDGRIERINDAYINTALRDTSGIDASLNWRWDWVNFGAFRLNLGYSLVLTNKYQLTERDQLKDYRDLPPVFFYTERSRGRGSLAWQNGDWSSSVFATRYGSAWRNSGTRRMAPWTLWNASVGKRFGDLSVNFTVVNVLNHQYRYDDTNTAYPFFNYALGADPLGRRYFLEVGYKF